MPRMKRYIVPKMPEGCKGCFYRRPISEINNGSETVCHYILMEGKKRGCPVENCNRYIAKNSPEAREKERQIRSLILREAIGIMRANRGKKKGWLK